MSGKYKIKQTVTKMIQIANNLHEIYKFQTYYTQHIHCKHKIDSYPNPPYLEDNLLLFGSELVGEFFPSLLAAVALDVLASEPGDTLGDPGVDLGEPPRLDTVPLVSLFLTTERKRVKLSLYKLLVKFSFLQYRSWESIVQVRLKHGIIISHQKIV